MVKDLKLTLLPLVLLAASANADSYLVQDPDISIGFNIGVISRAVSDLQGLGYQGRIDTNSPCGKSTLTFSLDIAQLVASSIVNLRSGTTTLKLGSGFKFSGNLKNCALSRATLACDTQQAVSGLFSNIDAAARCRWFAGVLAWYRSGTVQESFSLPVNDSIKFAESIDIEIRDTPEFEVEFGEFEGGIWQTAPDQHKKTINFSSTAYGSHSKNIQRPGNITKFLDTQSMRLNLNSGRTYFRESENRNDAERTYDGYIKEPQPTWASNDFIRLSIRDSFFSKRTPEGDAGIFNDILPIRLKEKRNDDKEPLDIALSDALVRYGELKGNPVIYVAFSLKGVNNLQYYENSQASFIFSVPTLANGRLQMELIDAKLKVKTRGIGQPNDICLSAFIKDIFVDQEFKLADTNSIIEITAPTCIDTGNADISPRKSCPGNQKGKMSRIGNFKSTRIEVLHDQARFEQPDHETLSFVIPYRETKY